ncbi:MAG: hypothetical protein M3433_00235 [Actinomycetota bacterium]|nr:hypothetical protein [Actinomycetota bacterium]
MVPAIASHRPVVGPPIRIVKRTLHRLLVPLVFAPQAEFNLRVAMRLNESKAVEEQLNDLSAISNENRRRIDELTEDLAELRGEVLAVRAEVQSQRALIETETNAAAAETANATGGGAG